MYPPSLKVSLLEQVIKEEKDNRDRERESFDY